MDRSGPISVPFFPGIAWGRSWCVDDVEAISVIDEVCRDAGTSVLSNEVGGRDSTAVSSSHSDCELPEHGWRLVGSEDPREIKGGTYTCSAFSGTGGTGGGGAERGESSESPMLNLSRQYGEFRKG